MKSFFEGYNLDAEEVLNKTFRDVGGYDDMVLVKDIPFFSPIANTIWCRSWEKRISPIFQPTALSACLNLGV